MRSFEQKPDATNEPAAAPGRAGRPNAARSPARSLASAVSASLGTSHDFGRINVFPAQERFEQEADRLAERVVRMPEPAAGSPLPTSPAGSDGPNRGASHPSVKDLLRTPGRRLDPAVRAFMEPRFGQDFDAVRIHTDLRAASAASALRARAFTVGRHVAFGHGRYAPDKGEGRRLLAHELTHVLQQRNAGDGPEGGLIQRDPLPERERETPDYTLERLISELNDHIDHGRMEQAMALLPRIQHLLDDDVLSATQGDDAAQALLRLGLDEGMAALQGGRRAQVSGYGRHHFSLRALDLLLAEGERRLAAGDHEQAFATFEQMLRWLENPELQRGYSSSDWGAPTYVREYYPRVIEALFRIPAEIRQRGDDAAARRYRERIVTLVNDSSMTASFGSHVAQELFDQGLDAEALEMLQSLEQQDTPSPGHETDFPAEALDLIMDNAESALAAEDWETAYGRFLAALGWMRERDDLFDSSFILNYGQRRRFLARTLYRIMGGLLAIVQHRQHAAETAYRAGDAAAGAQVEATRDWLRRMEGGLSGVLDQVAIVAEIEPTGIGEETAVYRDAFDPTRELTVGAYEGEHRSHDLLFGDVVNFEDRQRQIRSILRTLRAQSDVVSSFYEADAQTAAEYQRRHGSMPDVHSLDDRRRFWHIKYEQLIADGSTREQALQALIDRIGAYLRAYTIHSEYDIDDATRDPLTTDFPRAITQQALMDCGIYAMRTAHELSLIRDPASLAFHYVLIPNHVYLAVVDRGHAFGWGLSNHQFLRIRGDIAALGVGQAVANMFATVPHLFHTEEITDLSERALVRELNVPRPDYFRPANYARLSSTARREADATAESLRSDYVSLRDAIDILGVAVALSLRDLRARYEALPEGERDSPAFREEAIRELSRFYAGYVTLSGEAGSYADRIRTLVGDDAVPFTGHVGGYFRTMYRVMRYLVHQLGQSQYEDDAFVRRPVIDPYQADYRGDPPPWIR